MHRDVSGPLRRDGELLKLAATEPEVCAIGTWQNLVVVVWWSAGTGLAVERLERVMLKMRDSLHSRASHIHLVKNRAGMPRSDARATLIRLMSEYAPEIANCAVVIGGTGFWASTMRSAITSMRLLSPRTFEMRLHGETADILEWLPQAHQQRTGVELPRGDLFSVLAEAERWLDADATSLKALA